MATKKKRKVRQPDKEFDLYVIEIDSWEAPYSFGVNLSRSFFAGAFSEDAGVKISGKFILPEKIAGKDISMSLDGSREVTPYLNNPQKYDDHEPRAVGTLTVRGKHRDGYVAVPMDTLPLIISMLHAGRYKYLVMNGHALYRGHANIRSVSFYQTYDEDDW